MGRFTHPPGGKEPIGQFTGRGIDYQIHEIVGYEPSLVVDGNRVGTIIVPAGTVTDFASVPRFFWRIISPVDNDVRMAAIIHDHLYTDQAWTKKVADLIFKEALIANGAPVWKATAMYQAVKWCGGKAWNDHKAAKAIQQLGEKLTC